jgi:hypothetical protein
MAPPQLITSSPVVSDDSSSSEYPLEKKPAVPGVIIKDAQLVTENGNIVTKDGVVVSTEEADTSLAGNIFQDPEVRAFYVKMYEDCEYECRHVFDGDLTWSKEEEKALVRKIDFRGESGRFTINWCCSLTTINSNCLVHYDVLCFTSRPCQPWSSCLRHLLAGSEAQH